MPSIRKILSLSPHLEAAVRNVYWGSPILPTLVTRLDDRKAKRKKDRGEKPPSTSIEGIVEQLRAWGVGEGDLLLVHSGYRGIRGGKRSPDDILDQLLNLVGPHGTLCLPSIPYWPEAPKLYDRFVVDYNDIVLDYDPEVTPAWTGAVANAMIKRPQAVRSLHPLNTMAAIGPMAVDMVKNDLNGERPFPNGPQSSWRFCYDNDAWIVAMGADMAHSLTMIHLAEDYLGEQWPVEDWYRDRRFRVKIDGAWQEKVVRERHPRWARYYGERTLSRDLIAAGITRRVQLDGVNVELLRTRELIDYLNRRNHTLYPYFLIPQRFHKADPRREIRPLLVQISSAPGRALAQTPAGVLIERNGTLRFYSPTDGTSQAIGSFPSAGLRGTLGNLNRLAGRALRSGALSAVALNDSQFIVATKKTLYDVDIDSGEIKLEHRGSHSALHLSICKDLAGFQDRVLYGDYGSNPNKAPMSVHGRSLHGGPWRELYTFAPGEINHIHAVVPDPLRGCVWILVGDYGDAAGIWCARDDFADVRPIVRGDQRFRTCMVFPRPEGLLYATDSHLRPNSIRMLEPQPDGSWLDRQLATTVGSCLHATKIGQRYVFTSSVEPGPPLENKVLSALDPRRGPGISVSACQVMIGTPEQGFTLELEWATDHLPKRLFGFSTITVPNVHGEATFLTLTGAGVSGHDHTTEFYELTQTDT